MDSLEYAVAIVSLIESFVVILSLILACIYWYKRVELHEQQVKIARRDFELKHGPLFETENTQEKQETTF
jgi:hypothetical protein